MSIKRFLLTIGVLLPFLMSGGKAFAAVSSDSLTSKDKVRIYGYLLELRLQEEGTDQYNLLFKELERQGLPFDLVVQPFNRIIRDLSDHSDCMFPVSINALKTGKPDYMDVRLIASEPVDHISLRVFTRADSSQITDISELNGKKVALWDGLDSEIFLNGINATVETTPNELVRLKMLDKGRIDAILGFTPDVILAAEKAGIMSPHYASSLALFRAEGASLVCHDTPSNRSFIDLFDQLIGGLKAGGRLREILGPHAELAP